MGIYQTYVLLLPDEFTKNLFSLVDIPPAYRTKLGLLFVLNSFISYTFEKFFIGWYNRFYTQRQE